MYGRIAFVTRQTEFWVDMYKYLDYETTARILIYAWTERKERAVAPACSRALNRPERGRKYSTWSLPTCDTAALHRYKNPRNAMYNGF
jgi:hypothetical protein